jgi:hypothetical protein
MPVSRRTLSAKRHKTPKRNTPKRMSAKRTPKKSNPWLKHLKAFRAAHPHIKGAAVMTAARKTYR